MMQYGFDLIIHKIRVNKQNVKSKARYVDLNSWEGSDKQTYITVLENIKKKTLFSNYDILCKITYLYISS